MGVFLPASALWEAWGYVLQRQPPPSLHQTKLELLVHFLGVDGDPLGHTITMCICLGKRAFLVRDCCFLSSYIYDCLPVD